MRGSRLEVHSPLPPRTSGVRSSSLVQRSPKDFGSSRHACNTHERPTAGCIATRPTQRFASTSLDCTHQRASIAPLLCVNQRNCSPGCSQRLISLSRNFAWSSTLRQLRTAQRSTRWPASAKARRTCSKQEGRYSANSPGVRTIAVEVATSFERSMQPQRARNCAVRSSAGDAPGQGVAGYHFARSSNPSGDQGAAPKCDPL